ncbi:MAG TPA: multicopper oxidase family protein [Stellaceae bacterium]|nr:multicopper oxidase family protein [Stellaceae bacterium]
MRILVVACLAWLAASAARADYDDRPGFDFHPQSTPEAPCGTGTPPRGHFSLEIVPASRLKPIALTIRQDPNRLCYVIDTIAEAPLIRVRQGDTLTITLRNEIADPGAIDRTVPVATLDEPNRPVTPADGLDPVVPGMTHHATGASNLHFHGFPVPPVPPQDEVLKTCVDPAVGPAACGRREFAYRVQVPADMPAGLYWYHPHVHGEIQAQMLMGLSGAIVVEGKEDDLRHQAGIQEHVFIVRQSRDIDAPKAASAAADKEPLVEHPPIGGKAPVDTTHELPCSANTGIDEISLNGSKVVDGDAPDADLAPVAFAPGTKQFWRFLNAATDSYLNLALIDETGKPLPLIVAARDGAPITDDAGNRIAPAPTTEPLLVPPAGRIEFYVEAPPAGGKAYLVSRAVDTGCAGDKVPARRLILAQTLASSTPPPNQPIPAPLTLPSRFDGLVAERTTGERTIVLAEYPRPGSEDRSDFYIAEQRPGTVLRPFEPGAAPAITVQAGAVEEWTVENWTNEVHAFHIHQMHFRVLAIDGKTQGEPPLLDTVDVRQAGPDGPGRVRIKLAFPADIAGDIPFHCHLADHEDNGMMGVIRVVAGGERKASLVPVGTPPICRGGTRRTASAGAGQGDVR